MFTASGNLTTCLSIYPNATDDWSSSSPFSGETLNNTYSFSHVDNDDQGAGGGIEQAIGIDEVNGILFSSGYNGGATPDIISRSWDSDGNLTYISSLTTLNRYMEGKIAIDTNLRKFFCVRWSSLGSFSYDADGTNIQAVDWDNWVNTTSCIDTVVDPDHRLVFVADALDGIVSFSYDLSGNLTYVDTIKTAASGYRGIEIDTVNHKLFVLRDTDSGIEINSYTNAGMLSFVDSEVPSGGLTWNQGDGITVDTTLKIITCGYYETSTPGNALATFSYEDVGFTISQLNNYTVSHSTRSLSIDTTNNLIAAAAQGNGVYLYTYNSSGVLVEQDNDDQGAFASWGIFYTGGSKNLYFLANHSRGMESYSYTIPETAFVFSNSIINNYNKFNLIEDRLTEVGKVTNNINFVAKTNLAQKKEVQTKGIGGISKLKNFTFKLTEGDMTLANITSLLGRKVRLYYTQTTGVEDPDGADSTIEFTGEIFSHDRRDDEVTFTVKGLLHSANPVVGGNVVEASDGSQKTETLVFGDAGEIYVPLIKKLEDGVYKLHFSQGDDFIITGLYSKGGSEEEPLYNKINTNYTISDDEIEFNNNEYQNVFLVDALGSTAFSNHLDRARVSGVWEIGLTFDQTFTPPAPGTNITIGGYDGASYLPITNRITYQRSETYQGQTIYIFNCGWECIFGYYGKGIDDGSFVYGGSSYALQINSPTDGWITIDQRFIGSLNNPIEKETDALPWTSGAIGADDNSNWDTKELKDYLVERDDQSIKDFQLIPEEGLVIKIDDEEMLVVYTEKDSQPSGIEFTTDTPDSTYIWIVRGWNNTTITTHNANAPITVLDGVSQSIIYTMERALQDLNTMTPSYSWNVANMNNFLSGSGDLVVGNNSFVYGHDPVGYIGLNFRLPDLSGDFVKATLVGEASAVFDNSNSFSSPDDDWRECSINIAFNSPTEGTLINHRRRAFGENYGESYSYQWALAYYNYRAGSPKTIDGKYQMILKTSWGFDGTFDSDAHPSSNNMNLWQNPGTNEFDFKTYDELKEASMYMVFNSSNRWLKTTTFTISRPTIHVQMKQKLEDADIYARVIPKSIFDTPKDTFAIGTNCKICWHPRSKVDDTYDKKDTIMVSDDSSRYMGALTLDASNDFDTFYQSLSGETTTGILVEGVNSPNDIGKIFPSIDKSEYLTTPYGLPPFTDTLATGYPNGKIDVGVTFLENDLCYFWVDQDNSLIKSVLKNDISVGNPVNIIQDMLNTYYDNVTIDTTAFTSASALRSSHKMRLVVSSEKYLIDLIDQISKEHGLLTFENNDGEMSITTLDPPLTGTRVISTSEMVFAKDLQSFKEEFIDIEYLITDLDVYYDYRGNSYKGYIQSDDLTDQTYLTEASSYVNNKINVRLNLQTVFDSYVANLCAQVKMTYHKSPTRIIILETTMGTADIHVGQWVTIAIGSYITEITNKIYLVIKDDCSPPFKSKYKRWISLFEFDITNLEAIIREVPDQSVNTNYEENYTAGTDYEEVPDV